MIVPDHKITSPEELFPGWMLLSHNKSVRSSSELRKYPACCAVDEDTLYREGALCVSEYLGFVVWGLHCRVTGNQKCGRKIMNQC
mgnify:CR=1 FL=1